MGGLMVLSKHPLHSISGRPLDWRGSAIPTNSFPASASWNQIMWFATKNLTHQATTINYEIYIGRWHEVVTPRPEIIRYPQIIC